VRANPPSLDYGPIASAKKTTVSLTLHYITLQAVLVMQTGVVVPFQFATVIRDKAITTRPTMSGG